MAPTNPFPSTLASKTSTSERAVPTRTILVIEDYSDTRELICSLLRKRGYNVIEAEGGLEGLLKATALCPDLVLTDLSLPEMDGVEAARRIHEQPKLAHTPIFVFSAFLTKEVEADVRAAGCAEVFSKPFDATVLLARIEATLSK